MKQDIESQTWPWSLAIAPKGDFLYVACNGASEVAAFQIDSAAGTLTEVDRKSAGNSPLSITLDVTGKFAYVASVTYGTASRFNLNGSLSDEFIAASGLDAATRVVTDPSGRFVYVVNYHGISAFSRDAGNGNLTLLGTTTAGNGADAITLTP